MRLLRLLTRSLILLLIALFSALTAMRLAIHGREVRVPDLVGMTALQAQQTANANGLLVEVDDKFYSPTVPAGKLISQAPSPNSKVRRGWRVRVSESLGPQRVAIPDLTNESERAATINLKRRGLDLATVADIQLNNVPPDQVVAQSPTHTATELTSPKVSILVAASPAQPQFVMPNFVGSTLAEARDQIARAGFPPASVSAASATLTGAVPGSVPPLPLAPISGMVTSQSPPAGSRVTSDTNIHLEVAPQFTSTVEVPVAAAHIIPTHSSDWRYR